MDLGTNEQVSLSYKALRRSHYLGDEEALGSRQEKVVISLNTYERLRTHARLYDCGTATEFKHPVI
jgi:hypothetical protein